jgi:hypothetical protein
VADHKPPKKPAAPPVKWRRALPAQPVSGRDLRPATVERRRSCPPGNSQHVLAIFDSCFSGTVFNVARSLPPPAITLATTQPVREFISSGEAEQQVSDDGTFRKLFLDVLTGKEPDADANHDGYVTGTELGLFLHQKMTNLTNNRQTPRYGKLNALGYDRGDFVFQIGKPEVPATALIPTTQPNSEAGQAWAAMQGTTSQAVLEDFIRRFGDSFYGTLARDRLEELKKSQVSVVTPPPQGTSATSKEQATQPPPATSNQEAPATVVRAPNGTTVSFPGNATVAIISDAMAMQFGTGTLESVATGGYQWRIKTEPSPPSTTKPAQHVQLTASAISPPRPAQPPSTTQQTSPPSSSVLEAIPINDLPLPPANGGLIAVKTVPVKGTNFFVQIAVQKSEEDAQTTFRFMQAKYPRQLGGRQPIIRRKDLDKGVAYGVQVGPFAVRDEAIQLCESLKSAGGSCMIQNW